MSSVLCQNLHSCFEPRALGLQVSSNQLPFLFDVRCPPVSTESNSHAIESRKYGGYVNNNNNNNKNDIKANFDGWSFIESLTKEVDEKKDMNYVHPLVKRSASSLSEKSLELCTENLGGETGNNVEVSDNISLSTYSMSKNSESCRRSSSTREISNLQQFSVYEKAKRRSFPPPLTSISNCDSVQYRPHREGGRLVIKAIAVATSTTYFQAERGNGRLRLLLKEPFQEEEEEEEQEREKQEESDQEEESTDAYLGEEMDENKGDKEGELGIGNFRRPTSRRCNEGPNKELSKWEHFWVAT